MDFITVLLVDDDERLLDGLATLLSRRLLLVHTARDAAEALDVLARHHIDVVISDENMPGQCGTQLLALLVDKYPHVARVLMTGEPKPQVASTAIGLGGVFRFLIKPISPSYLVKVIEQAVRDHTPPPPRRAHA